MDLAIAALARLQHGVISLEQLRGLGLTASAVRMRVASGRLHRLYRGVYAVGHRNLSRRGWWMAAVLAFAEGALLSHRHAAALWGLLPPVDTAIDVTVDTRGGRRRRRGLVAHRCRLHDDDRERRHEIPVTSVARTLLDLAEVVSATQLQRAYEAAERLELLDVRALQALLERSNGRRGVASLRALSSYDPSAAARARSELERRFLDLLRAANLPTPLVNAYVEGLEVDAYWPHARLVVELDSWEFHRGRFAFERDREKIAELSVAGYEVLPLTDRRLERDRPWVVETLRALLERPAADATL